MFKQSSMMKAGKLILFLTAVSVICSCGPKFKPFVFVHMTDTQVGFADRSEGYVHSDSLLAAAVGSVNNLKPEFAVVTGDLVDDVDDPLQDAIFKARMSELEVPCYLLPGNHDYRKQWTREIRDEYVAHRGSERFSFIKNGCAFIGIDSNCIKERASEAEDEQMEWLKGELKKAGKAKYTFVFLHCPIFINDIDEEEDYENFPPERRREYITLFKDAGVDAVLAGHTHQDYDTVYDGIRLIAANPVCNPLGHGKSGFNTVSVGKDGFEVGFVRTEFTR